MSIPRTPFLLPRNVPLAVPGSRRVEHCYALHGKARGRGPGRNSHVELVLVDGERDVRNVLGYHHAPDRFACDVEPGWHVLGWRMADGSMPLGDYERVDPDLAQVDALPEPCRESESDASVDYRAPNEAMLAYPGLLT